MKTILWILGLVAMVSIVVGMSYDPFMFLLFFVIMGETKNLTNFNVQTYWVYSTLNDNT